VIGHFVIAVAFNPATGRRGNTARPRWISGEPSRCDCEERRCHRQTEESSHADPPFNKFYVPRHSVASSPGNHDTLGFCPKPIAQLAYFVTMKQ
jgi:hypothetical protein